ncbi:recombinase, phage RecT family (plasmid) [Leptotrichia wadei]|uniref:Recombinase, phage RecT family n=1 Tax=Leptotrichia wadei TaxID=157687 RepID=A0A510KWK9_9FUSO|nr:recombinase, phage RecT family [Leptotrichia wadei]
MDLPIDPNLGFAYVVPYKRKYKDNRGNWQEKNEAQFQLGYKGFIQLAIRTGQYKKLMLQNFTKDSLKAMIQLLMSLNIILMEK